MIRRALALVLIAATVVAAPSYERQVADFSKPAIVSQWDISLRQGMNGYVLPFDLVNGRSGTTNVPISMTGWTAVLSMRKPTGVEAARLTGTVSGNEAVFSLTGAFLASPVKRWVLTLYMTQGSNVVNQAAGTISIEAAPDVDSGDLVLTRSINIGGYTWVGAFPTSTIPATAISAPIAIHAGIIAGSNTLGHVMIGDGIDITPDGVISASGAAPAWDDVTDKPAEFPPAPHDYSSITNPPWLEVEVDPYAVLKSSTVASWSDAGGSYTSAQVIATSPLLTNGIASVSWSASGMMQIIAETSDSTGTNWVAFAQQAAAGYVRLRTSTDLLPPFDATTSVSNIVARSWTRPDLVGLTNGTAGQIVLVDTATDASQPVPLAQMQSAIGAVTPSTWADYPATAPVRADKIIVGNNWSIHQLDGGMSYISYADAYSTTNALTIANNGTAAMRFTPGLAGLTITAVTLDGSNATVHVSTNGVHSEPFVRWTADLMYPDWTQLTPVSTTWPTATNGVYVITVVVPDTSVGYLSAARETGAARVDMLAPTTVPALTLGDVTRTNWPSGGGTSSTTNWIAATVIASAATVTVTSATASPLTLDLTNNTILSFDYASFPPTVTGLVVQGVTYQPNAFSFGLDTNTMSGTLPTPVTNAPNFITITCPTGMGTVRAEVR